MITDTQFSDDRWLQFWNNYKDFPHQRKAVALLGQHIRQADPCLLTESAEWVADYKAGPAAPAFSNPLKVKYQSQNDNKGAGWRECFSSSCAMLAMHWGKITNDDAYNTIRAKYGDSTDAQAQLSALRSLGLKADFHTDGDAATLEAEINAGRPVAVGWLHHGSRNAPTGGGHWSVVIGYNATSWILNDPNGVADLVNGGYTPNLNGAGVSYSRGNWNPRWMVGGSGGWYLRCQP